MASFIEAKLPVNSERQGDVLLFEPKSERSPVSHPDIRTHLKSFLHEKKIRRRFRILSEHGKIRFAKTRIEEENKKKKEAGTGKK